MLSKTGFTFRQSARFEGLPSLKNDDSAKKSDAIIVDEGARTWLKSNLDIDVKTLTNHDPKSATYHRRRFFSPTVESKSISNFQSQFTRTIESVDTLKNKLLSWIRNSNVGIRNVSYFLKNNWKC